MGLDLPDRFRTESAVQCQHDGVQPMLATPGDLPVGPDWVYEAEWDGLRARLEGLDLRATAGVALSPVYTDGQALRAATAQRGLSGVLAKRRDAPYRAGPDPAWVRVANRYRRGRGR